MFLAEKTDAEVNHKKVDEEAQHIEEQVQKYASRTILELSIIA